MSSASASQPSGAQAAQQRKQAELQNTYSNYKSTLQQLAQKIGDVETDAEEHKLVLESLTPVPADRKCFRMINGVLVERTVGDVRPSLETNAEGLKKVLDGLVKEYKRVQDEMDSWKGILSRRLLERIFQIF
ncbi:hypothetical protein TWF173_002049 [Orbilia oligospora]|uniref:Prefoldin subunit 2 n=1 Tax=Orbilia oligospora TaxID=2813651 RepID=A0A7C8RED4_ORBOL|nr:hypothetical protein TWF970_003818 [Orbilia oligospora]KAF3307980.1 hypothetical protein TWF173_002049 [Orbilia oligospora]